MTFAPGYHESNLDLIITASGALSQSFVPISGQDNLYFNQLCFFYRPAKR